MFCFVNKLFGMLRLFFKLQENSSFIPRDNKCRNASDEPSPAVWSWAPPTVRVCNKPPPKHELFVLFH